jgi:predicted RNase H-like HicB family nuclease
VKKTPVRDADVEYTMVIEPARGKKGTYYAGYFPDLPGCTTMGSDLKELRRNAKEAVSLHIQALRETGQPVPKPGSLLIRVKVPA